MHLALWMDNSEILFEKLSQNGWRILYKFKIFRKGRYFEMQFMTAHIFLITSENWYQVFNLQVTEVDFPRCNTKSSSCYVYTTATITNRTEHRLNKGQLYFKLCPWFNLQQVWRSLKFVSTLRTNKAHKPQTAHNSTRYYSTYQSKSVLSLRTGFLLSLLHFLTMLFHQLTPMAPQWKQVLVIPLIGTRWH